MSWSGPKEKKWEWYKHTKPCYNMIYVGCCENTNCNYAHTLDQYVDAILKRSFKLDFEIINQLKKISSAQMDVDMNQSTTEENGPSAKRRRVE